MADSQDSTPTADQAAPADSSPAENNQPEPAEAPKETPKEEKADPIMEALSDEPKGKSDKQAEPDKPEEQPKEEEPADPKEQPQEDEKLAPKSENRFQKLANENRELKENLQDPEFLQQQLAQLSQREQQIVKEQELLEAEDPETGQPYSMEDIARIARYQANQETLPQIQMQQHQLGLSAESIQIMNDHQIFNPSSPEFKPELAQRAAQAMEPYLIRDPNVPEIDPSTGQPTGKGQVIGSRVSPSAIYKPIADAYEMSRAEGQIAGQRNAEQMMSSTDPSTSAGPAKRKTDPVMDILSSDE